MELFDRIKRCLKEELATQAYEIWIKPLKVGIFHEERKELEIYVPSEFYLQWLKKHYETKIREYAEDILKTSPINIKFKVSKLELPSSKVDTIKLQVPKVKFNPKYTFSNFVVGPSNRLAYAASYAVATTSTPRYNPLFIYGGVGLGKTHLLQAIGQHILTHSSQTRVVYTSTEQFMLAYIEAVQRGRRYQFQERYRQVDLLLVDDVEYLAGREGTQEEFFHTFTVLYEGEKYIVLSSDRPPKDIPGLQGRLRSRFEAGLIADIQPPEFETRVAILKKTIENTSVSIPQEVILFIADKIKTNIRDLKGALSKIIAYSTIQGEDINLELTERVLKDTYAYQKTNKKIIDINTLKNKVAAYFKINIDELSSKRRTSQVVLGRQVAMYLARELTNLSFFEIGKSFGSRDHSTVIYGYKKIKEQIAKDSKLKKIIEELISQLT